MLLDAVARPRLQLREAPAALGDADDRHRELAAFHHRLQRRKDLLVGKIAGCAEEDQRVAGCGAHAGFSMWPPN
jgi:hypothetical protein